MGLSFKDSLRHQYWLGSFNEYQKKELYNQRFLDGLNNSSILNNVINNHHGFLDNGGVFASIFPDTNNYLEDTL